VRILPAPDPGVRGPQGAVFELRAASFLSRFVHEDSVRRTSPPTIGGRFQRRLGLEQDSAPHDVGLVTLYRDSR